MYGRIRNPRPWSGLGPFVFSKTLFRTSCVRNTSTQASRIDRMTSKLPRPLQKYTAALRTAPMSHVVSFLILHELTAIVPLFGLFAVFHYTDYVPTGYMTHHFRTYVDSGIARFEKYFKRKEWFGFTNQSVETSPDAIDNTVHLDNVLQRSQSGDQKYQLLVNVALAYAITKVLLPVRIIGSVWATPWFARNMLKLKSLFSRAA